MVLTANAGLRSTKIGRGVDGGRPTLPEIQTILKNFKKN
jgi:hypothetical protein